MTATYENIATQTLTSNTTTISFTSIPGTFTDLVLVMNNNHTTGAIDGWFRLNGDTGTNYSRTNLTGDGSSATSGRNTSVAFGYGILTTDLSRPAVNILQFMNYSNTTTNKTILIRSNIAALYTQATVDLWRSTAAITSIDISAVSGQYTSGSTFTLYGIKAE